MEEAEQSRYVAQLKAEFDSCDATSSGFLGPQEVTALCGKLHLDVQLPLVLDSLLGGGAYARVDFEAFKDNFVDVLSRSLDLTADDDSRCQQPVVADEVKPKFVKGGKRYGRRSRPDIKPSRPSDDSPPPPPCTGDTVRSSPGGARGPKVRRSTCPDSVESPKSDEEAGSPEDGASVRFRSKASEPEEEESARDGPVGRRPGAQERGKSEQVAPGHFQNLLCGCAPVCCSTPRKTAPEDGPTTVTAGPEVLSRLDDGSGRASPERVVALWAEEGVRDGRDVLRTLDFPAEERVSLRELTSALDNELAVSGNRIHRAALICYKNEIRHLRARAEQARGERDKAGADLERAERRNLRLVREADERHAGMEELHRTGIRKLERDFRERLAAQRGQAEQESADAVQQLEQERQKLQRQLTMLRAQEAGLQEELGGAAQENRRLREELVDVRRRLNEAESGARRLHADFNRLLHHKWSSSDAVDSAEDELARLLRDYEHRCRELRDKNDELSSELELMRSHEKSDRKSPHAAAAAAELCWSEAPSASELDSDDCDTMRRLSAARPDDATAAVSVETELAVEKLKSEHEREMRRLDIQTETQVNYYKCGLDRMRQSMEAERQDMAQAFKLEISELEDQKAEAERQAELLKEALDKLHNQIQHGGRSAEEERRMRRERADSERNFAREMGNLVRRLNAEKEQLEAELKLKMDREVMVVRSFERDKRKMKKQLEEMENLVLLLRKAPLRTHLEEARSDNVALHERLRVLQQEVVRPDDEVVNDRRKLEEEQHHQSSRQEVERLHKEERHEKALTAARHRTRELEAELEACRGVLHEKLRQLQRQAANDVKSGAMLKELYVENAQLMKTLQLTEERHKNARDDNALLEEKVRQLNKLLADVVPAALRT